MKLKSLKIGNIVTKNNIFLAPLAGFSDFAMRSICLSYGAGLAFTEMVSCKGLLYNNENTNDLLYTTDDEKIKCAQIFGNDPEVMRRAIELPALDKFDVIDVNFGCPMPKIFQNGEGSALLDKPHLAQKIISELKKSGKTITAKMRIGITRGNYVTEDFVKALEQGGVDMITVHGRTRDMIYSGEPNYDEIYKAKRAVKVPVIANGGIFSVEDVDKMTDNTGADGIMLARGALERPWLFSKLCGKEVEVDKKSLIYRHIDLLNTHFDDSTTAVLFRKQICLYIKGEVGNVKLKDKIFKMKNTADIKTAVGEFFDGKR
ncbi:MAG: tRNA-dihydrouridine synthase family protein [Clostridia bacterium]|nr:tRNA-dihydrouridine synthase family protein [Clostridia bacterium]